MASDPPLGSQNILQAMADALPTHHEGDGTSDMSSSAEAVALFTHACMFNLGFRLLGFNDDQKMESECASLAPRLPAKWNASVSSYSFLYAHTQSSMQFIIRIDRLGAKIEIRGLAVGADKINRLELTTRDYISSAALPLRIAFIPSDGQTDAKEDRSDLPSKLQAIFISRERITDLANLVKINIIQPLIPSLQKEGYQESTSTAQDNRANDCEALREADRIGRRDPPHISALPSRFDDPSAAGIRRPLPGDFPPPDFEDEFEMFQPGRLQRPGTGGGPFFGGIGRNDLHPPGLGPDDPLRQSFVPGSFGSPFGGGGFMGGGMHSTFDDPLFQGPRRNGSRGLGRGPGSSQAPPGARWDPAGPSAGGPRFGGPSPDTGDFGFDGDTLGGFGSFGGGRII